MMRRIIVAAAVTVVAAALAPAAGASSWGPDSNSCTGTLEDPHYSIGARGVIVKSHFMCTEGGRDIINHMTALFWCGTTQPIRDEAWLTTNCARVGTNTTELYNLPAYDWKTLYAPPVGHPNVAYGGWYMACQQATSRLYFQEDSHLIFSTHAYWHNGDIPMRQE